MSKMYRLKTNPKIVVEKLGEGFMRHGAKMKFPSVTYKDAEGCIDQRSPQEFERLFEVVR